MEWITAIKDIVVLIVPLIREIIAGLKDAQVRDAAKELINAKTSNDKLVAASLIMHLMYNKQPNNS